MFQRKIWAVATLTSLAILLHFSTLAATEFSVTRPSKLRIPREIKRVYIDPDKIENANDRLNIKYDVLRQLKDQLNSLGRFSVTIGTPTGFDPNKTTVAVIQGDVISGGEIVDGQMTEKAECVSGLSGLVGAATASGNSKQGITVSRRGMLCKKANIGSVIVEKGFAQLLSAAGLEENPRIDEVVRVYKYRNFSLFAQVNLSMTQIGLDRETLTIRADAASFSRHVIAPNTFRNVRESGDNAPLIWLWFKITPIAPVIIKDIGVVSATNPGSSLGRWYNYVTPSIKDIPSKERDVITRRLINKTIQRFIQSVSPYKVTISTSVANGGNGRAGNLIEQGQYLKAREILRNPQNHADLYNLGLTYEAGARTVEDYEDALQYYGQALDKAPGNRLYIAGIGRMESQLRAYNRSLKALN